MAQLDDTTIDALWDLLNTMNAAAMATNAENSFDGDVDRAKACILHELACGRNIYNFLIKYLVDLVVNDV